MKTKLFLLTFFLAGFYFAAFSQENITFTWDIDEPATEKEIRMIEFSGDAEIHWGDGAIEEYSGRCEHVTHLYAEKGTFTVNMVCKNEIDGILEITIHDNKSIHHFDVTNAHSLGGVSLINANIDVLDLSNNVLLGWISILRTEISTLDISSCPLLVNLLLTATQIKELDCSANNNLGLISLEDNPLLTKMNIANCSSLHQFSCYNSALESLDLSGKPELTSFECANNKLKSLDISDSPLLRTLHCSNNEINEIFMPEKDETLWALSCDSNHLSLGQLYYLSSYLNMESDANSYFGAQTLPLVETEKRATLPIDTIFWGENTTFEVFKNDAPALENEDYIIHDGFIVFLEVGQYKVDARNPALDLERGVTNIESYYNVKYRSNADLIDIEMSAGVLTPFFNANITEYAVEVASDIDAVSITGIPRIAESTVHGNVADFPLAYGQTDFTLTVVAEDGVTTKKYTVSINREKPHSIADNEDNTEIYPNPAVDKVYIVLQESTLKRAMLFNQLGQQVKEAKELEINVGDLPAGLYILQVKTDKGNVVRKVVKQ